jgi:hypothetical protein
MNCVVRALFRYIIANWQTGFYIRCCRDRFWHPHGSVKWLYRTPRIECKIEPINLVRTFIERARSFPRAPSFFLKLCIPSLNRDVWRGHWSISQDVKAVLSSRFFLSFFSHIGATKREDELASRDGTWGVVHCWSNGPQLSDLREVESQHQLPNNFSFKPILHFFDQKKPCLLTLFNEKPLKIQA